MMTTLAAQYYHPGHPLWFCFVSCLYVQGGSVAQGNSKQQSKSAGTGAVAAAAAQAQAEEMARRQKAEEERLASSTVGFCCCWHGILVVLSLAMLSFHLGVIS